MEFELGGEERCICFPSKIKKKKIDKTFQNSELRQEYLLKKKNKQRYFFSIFKICFRKKS